MATSADLDDLTYDREEEGVLVRKQLDRVIVTQGAWATVMFLYQELDRGAGAYRAPQMTIVRFRKWRGGYRKHAAFNLANEAQARQLTAVFERWYPKIEEALALGAPAARADDEAEDDDHPDDAERADVDEQGAGA
jgi:hypothetical protein